MLSKKFGDLKKEILDILSEAEFELEKEHAVDTLNWVKKIDPEAGESLQIAALGHDLERAVGPMVRREDGESHANYKKRHSERSSQILAELMKKHGYNQATVDHACELVRLHETGGDYDADILRDADSVSFFSCNIEWYYEYKNRDLDVVRHQIEYKYSRATPRAKKLIRTIKIKNKVLNDLCQEIFS